MLRNFRRFIEYRSSLAIRPILNCLALSLHEQKKYIEWKARLAYRRYKFKGLFNYFLSLIDANLRLPFCLGKPTRLDITIIEGRCNFSCKMCSLSLATAKREISFAGFKRIFDASKYVASLNLLAWGEPFMVKDIFRMIDYATVHNCSVGTVTNMSLINEAMARKIIESRLDSLAISFDAAEPGLFERIRQGAKFQTIVNNIKILNRLKKEYRLENPQLSLIVTAMKENIYEIPKIIELAHQLEIKEVKINPLMVFGVGAGLAIEEQSLTNFPELTQGIFTAAKKRAKELGINFSCPDYRRHRSSCKLPWLTLNALMNGKINLCCSYYPGLGNMFEDGINNIWNSRNFRLIRKATKKENSICYWCVRALNGYPNLSRPI
ncbi:MAG: radical SAM protein [Candidatus Omnitrophota bacterium]